MSHLKGLLVVLFAGGIMWMGWSYYRDFLYQGQKPTQSTQVLNEIERKGVPDFELNDVNGKAIQLSTLQDKIVIVNFWASWCDPCVEEFPSLMALLKEFPKEVVLLAISADYNMEDMNNFLKAFKAEGPNLHVLWDKDQKVAKSYGTTVLPESYILGYNNKLIRKVAGVDDWSSPYALDFFRNLIAEKP